MEETMGEKPKKWKLRNREQAPTKYEPNKKIPRQPKGSFQPLNKM
jgi:hypothetical protein